MTGALAVMTASFCAVLLECYFEENPARHFTPGVFVGMVVIVLGLWLLGYLAELAVRAVLS